MQKLIALVCWLLIWPVLLSAQGWQRWYGGPHDDRFFALQMLPDGSMLTVGSTSPDTTGLTNWYAVQTDAFGNVLAEMQSGMEDWNEWTNVLLPGPAGGWLIAGMEQIPGQQFFPLNAFGVFVDSIGAPGSDVFLGDLDVLNTAILRDGGYLFAGAKLHPFGIDGTAPHPFCTSTDSTGTIQWTFETEYGQYGECTGVVAPPGGALLSGWYVDTVPVPFTYNSFVLKLDASGQLTGERHFLAPEFQSCYGMVEQPGGSFVLFGAFNENTFTSDIFLQAVNEDLDSLWSVVLDIPGRQKPNTACALPDGSLLIAGETIPDGTNSRDAFLARTDAQGNLQWFKTYGGLKGDIFWDVKPAPDGGFALAGQTASFGSGTLQAWLVRTDSLGNVWSNTVHGRVLQDTLADCVAQPSEPALENWWVTAAGAQGSVFATTDSLGTYTLSLDTGAWHISVWPPSAYWVPCADSVNFDFQNFNQDTTLDFAVQAAYDCPLLQVDITTPFLRRCFSNTYSVRYFNHGTAFAQDARVVVVLDPYLSIESATLPFTQNGDSLFIELGTVPSLQGGMFELTALLDCDSTVLGQVHCTSAHILPDSLCNTFGSDWDGSNLVVNGYCAGDSVVLTIANTGIAGMSKAVDFIITEDQIIFKQAPIQLAAGQDTTIVVYPSGATVILVVPQTPGHPAGSDPMLVIEGCGGFPFSTGYALQFPTDDGDPFSDLECRVSIGSYDPNTKTGLPEGVGTGHVIASGTAIEYLIRFQNTGTDTAFRVEIRDTLPAGLDLQTLEPGASSHPYKIELVGAGVLRFVFDPIVLPDSSADASASQGFVKFRIGTLPDLPDDSQIENRAAIYFDFNAPVLTDYTLHTIGNPFDWLLVSVSEIPDAAPQKTDLKATPNPFRNATFLTWGARETGKPYVLEILDMTGRLVLREETSDAFFNLKAGNLSKGLYLIRVWQSGQLVAIGRVISMKP